MIGDAGSDVAYTGETGDSSLSVQYYRNKVLEFQTILDALDKGAQSVRDALDSGALADSDAIALADSLNEYDAKKMILRTTAEGINAGAAAWNALGGRMPQLAVPSGLGLAPLIPIALIAAVATAATLIVWGRAWINNANNRLQISLDAIDDPDKRAQVAASAASAASAAALAESSPVSSIANIAKWAAIAALGFIGWKVYREWRDSR